jgi:transposase InsO family protein
MSKNRVIVLSVTHQNLSVSEVAKKYKVSKRWVYKLLAKERAGGIAAVEKASTRPKSHSKQTPDSVKEAIVSLRSSLAEQGIDNGAQTISWYLIQQGIAAPALSTIWRVLKNAGLVEPQPKKKPKAYIQRFEAAQPNETWQSDFTHWRLADGTDIEILNWLDDHSRYLLSCRAFKPVTGKAVVDTFKLCINEYGLPQSTLTDNGTVYTARFVKGKTHFELLLAQLGVQQKNGSPGHPTTQGKIERFHQTQKTWLAQQPRAENIYELQQQLDEFSHVYNDLRPHSAHRPMKTPLVAYHATIKATPPENSIGAHYRIRYDTVDKFGKLTLRRNGLVHHLGIGIKHARTPVLILVDETDVTVIHSATGEIIATHVIDDNHNYWPKQEGY